MVRKKRDKEEEDEERGQSLMLSLRISKPLRRFLDSVREMQSLRRGEDVSTSEVAKQLLELAGAEQLADVDFYRDPTGALVSIRRKLESGAGLSKTEWRLVVQYAQYGAERVRKRPISSESFAGLLRAFLSLLDRHEGELQDCRYYFSNLSQGSYPEQAEIGESKVRAKAAEVIEHVLETKQRYTALYAARNLWTLLDKGRFRSEGAIHEALSPHWVPLWHVAARGHYLRVGEPLREKSALGVYDYQENTRHLPALHSDGERNEDCCHLTFQQSDENGMNLLLSQPGRYGSMYPLSGYAEISEFRQMLAALHPDRLPKCDPRNPSFAGMWDGDIFFGYVPVTGESAGYWFRAYKNGITLGFSEESWRKVQDLFRRGWEDPEVAKCWGEMVMEYGE